MADETINQPASDDHACVVQVTTRFALTLGEVRTLNAASDEGKVLGVVYGPANIESLERMELLCRVSPHTESYTLTLLGERVVGNLRGTLFVSTERTPEHE